MQELKRREQDDGWDRGVECHAPRTTTETGCDASRNRKPGFNINVEGETSYPVSSSEDPWTLIATAQ